MHAKSKHCGKQFPSEPLMLPESIRDDPEDNPAPF
jgi:hypothetical protein